MASKRRISRSGAKRVIAAPRKRPAKTGAKSRAKRARGAKASRQQSVVEAVLATFAHEVRTPLTGILAISDLLATSELGERERQWVDTIKANAEHLAALATLFVDAARSQSTGLSLRKDFFDLRALTRAAADSLSGRAAAKGLQAQVELADDLPAFVIGDTVRLRAALENMVDNAVKFTSSGNIAFGAAPRRRRQGQGDDPLHGGGLRHRRFGRRDQAAVPAVLAGQHFDRAAVRWRRAWPFVGAAAGARDGRRRHGLAAQGRRHGVRHDRVVSARERLGRHGRTARTQHRPRRHRCAFFRWKTIRSAAWC